MSKHAQNNIRNYNDRNKKRKTEPLEGTKKVKKERRPPPKVAKTKPKPKAKVDNDQSYLSYYEEKCSKIAQLSEEILENPQEGIKKPSKTQKEGCKNESKVKEILDYANTFNSSSSEEEGAVVVVDYNVARLAIISLLAIFQDILPSYRIRQHSDAEMKSQRLKKETKEMWDYERDLVSHYQQYLKILENTWTGYCCNRSTKHNNMEQEYHLGITSLLTLCELLKTGYYFNFVSNILTLVVRQMSSKIQLVSNACCTTIHTLFKVDKQGDITREAVKLISQMILQRKFKIKPEVLQSFLHLPLQVQYEDIVAVRLLLQQQKKKRKQNADQSAIEDEMKEASGTIDKMKLAQMQSDTLHSITITYFRIVKSIQQPKKAMNLFPYALEGLAKFAHLIHIDTVLDLMELLKALLLQQMDNSDSSDTRLNLSVQTTCHCVLTAFQALSGPARNIDIDMKDFIVPLYNQIARFSTEYNSNQTPLLIQCLTHTFLKRREFSIPRLIAFLKMLLTLSIAAPTYTSVAILTLLQQIMHKYPSASSQLEQLLLDNESDKVCSIAAYYNPSIQDPELSNPLSTSAWEISLLKYHFHHGVRNEVTSITKEQKIGDNYAVVQKDATKIFQEMKLMTDRSCIHLADNNIIQRKHELKNLIKKDKRRKGGIKYRFVRPTKPMDLTRF